VGGSTGFGWTRWTEALIEVEVETGRTVLFTGGLVLDDGRAGAGWVEATEGNYITHRKMAALGKGMALADTEILRALPGSARLVAIFTDSVTARGTYLAFFRSLAPPGINSAPIACVAVPRCSHGCSGFSIHPPSSKGEPCNTGGIVADLQEWNRDMFEFASLTAKLLRSSNS